MLEKPSLKRLAWMTDIHLNFVSQDLIKDFARKILDAAPDAVLLGGGIGEADNVEKYLMRLRELLSNADGINVSGFVEGDQSVAREIRPCLQ